MYAQNLVLFQNFYQYLQHVDQNLTRSILKTNLISKKERKKTYVHKRHICLIDFFIAQNTQCLLDAQFNSPKIPEIPYCAT